MIERKIDLLGHHNGKAMYTGRTVFSQVMDFLPVIEFRQCVARYHGDHKLKSFSCLDHFLTLAFAQLSGRQSLRDIETCLRAMQSRLYHMGFRGNISRNNLAHANQHRDWRIYADLAQVLIAVVRPLYRDEPFGAELEETVYALDATTIDLCLSLCPWAPFERSRGAIKRQTLLDLRGSIPAFILVTHGRVSDKTILDQIPLEVGAFYVMDRGYIHFKRLFRLTTGAAFFVIRGHEKLQFRRRSSRHIDPASGLRADQTVMLTGVHTARDYPLPIRRVRYYDEPSGHRLTFMTNNFALPALTIANLYKSRADRAVLQMDQTAPAHQSLLRELGQRREDPDLDGHLGLPAGGAGQETTADSAQSLHNSPNCWPDAF